MKTNAPAAIDPALVALCPSDIEAAIFYFAVEAANDYHLSRAELSDESTRKLNELKTRIGDLVRQRDLARSALKIFQEMG